MEVYHIDKYLSESLLVEVREAMSLHELPFAVEIVLSILLPAEPTDE